MSSNYNYTDLINGSLPRVPSGSFASFNRLPIGVRCPYARDLFLRYEVEYADFRSSMLQDKSEYVDFIMIWRLL